MLGIGSTVRVLAPFAEFFPGVWTITGVSETGAWQIADGVDFAPEHLEEVTDGDNNP